MTLPVLDLQGSPFEQGVQHGRALQDRVRHNLAVYFERFREEAQLDREEVLTRAGRYLEAIEAQSPAYLEGMRGIAEGAGVPLGEVAALNVRYELLYYQFGHLALADGCTSFALLPEASAEGHLLLGQNWDWIPQVRGAVLHTHEPDGLQTVSFTEAGIFGGKIGLNSQGLGLAINGLTSTQDDWSCLTPPFHLRCYQILRCADFEAALGVVTREERPCSTNYLIAQAPDRVTDLEAAPSTVRALGCEGGRLVHTNHFWDPASLGIVEPPSEKRPHSRFRLERLRGLLRGQGRTSVEALQGYLRDHEQYPYSLCRHEDPAEGPSQRYVTVTSAVMDLNERELWLSDGPPCRSGYQRHAL